MIKITCFCGETFPSIEEWKTHYLRDTVEVSDMISFRNEENVPTCILRQDVSEPNQKDKS